jgi:hypothetical protein
VENNWVEGLDSLCPLLVFRSSCHQSEICREGEEKALQKVEAVVVVPEAFGKGGDTVYVSPQIYCTQFLVLLMLLYTLCCVRGSALSGLICAAASVQGDSFLGISSSLYLLGYVASLSTKLADTFASEIGKAYGKTTFLITTFERVKPGTEGAVSAEGSAASVVGG